MKRDILGYIPAVLLPAVLSFASLVIYTRHFAPVEYGLYVLLMGAAAFTGLIASQWLVQAAQKFRPVYSRRGDIERFNRHVLQLTAGGSVVLLVLLCSGWWGITRYGLATLEQYGLTAALVWTQMLYFIPLSLLQSDGKVKLYRRFQVGAAFLKFGGGLLCIYVFTPRIESLLYVAVLANVLLLAPLYMASGLLASMRLRYEGGGEWRSLTLQFIRYGFPMTAWAACTGILDISDRYMLQWLGEAEDVGIYAANYSLAAAIIGVVSAPIFSAAHPAIMNSASEEEVASRMTAFTRIFLLTALPIGCGLTIFHQEIGTLFLGPAYSQGSLSVPVLAIGILIWNLSIIGHKGYEYKGKTLTMLGFVTIAALLNIGLNLLLIPHHGVTGAAYATLGGFGAYTALIALFSGRFVRWSFPIRMLGKLGVMMVVTWLPVYLLREWLAPVLSPLAVAASGGLAASVWYVAVLAMFGELELRKIRDAANRFRSYQS